MCVLLLIVLIPAMLLFGAPFLAIFLGVHLFVSVADKKKGGDEGERSHEERSDYVVKLTALWSLVLLLLFVAFLWVRYLLT